MAATPSYQGQTTAAFNADTFRILKSTKHPDEAFTVLTYLLGRTRTCSSCTAACRRSSPSRTPSCRPSRPNYKQKIDWNVAKEGVKFADVPNFESYTPAYNQTLDLLNTSSHEMAGDARPRHRHRDRRPEDADAGHLGQGRQLDHGGPRVARPRPCPASRGWPGGAHAGATSSSRRGSSGSSCSRRSR